mgnify:CR=1 FL=1
MEKLLILNPGSTSTKIAYYEDEKQIFVESISHSADEIAKYDLIVDQYEFRKDTALPISFIREKCKTGGTDRNRCPWWFTSASSGRCLPCKRRYGMAAEK